MQKRFSKGENRRNEAAAQRHSQERKGAMPCPSTDLEPISDAYRSHLGRTSKGPENSGLGVYSNDAMSSETTSRLMMRVRDREKEKRGRSEAGGGREGGERGREHKREEETERESAEGKRREGQSDLQRPEGDKANFQRSQRHIALTTACASRLPVDHVRDHHHRIVVRVWELERLLAALDVEGEDARLAEGLRRAIRGLARVANGRRWRAERGRGLCFRGLS
eukprot:229611-Pleurochrysis_carterae.AAC.1